MAEACICAVCQDGAGDVVGNLFSKILSLVSDPITLVLKCNYNVDNWKQRADELKLRKGSAEDSVGVFNRRGEEITQELKNWLPRAKNLIEAANKLAADAEETAKKKCFFGLCLNPISRYQLSKKAKENSEAIVDLLEKPCVLNLPNFYIPAPPKEVAAPVKGFENFNSRNYVLERVMEALQSQSRKIIGVHGMPGIGKTMLAKEVKRKAEQDKLFDVAVMALVSRNADVKKIQVEIARGLGLDLIATQDAADRIKERLKKMKKVLIILDDIWRPGIDLEELGIPLRNEPKTIERRSSSREEYADCKILLTSRDSNVLSDLMGSQQNFPLHPLENEEAWKLLRTIVGDRAQSDDAESYDILRAAIEIVDECRGLPLAITTMLKALQNKKPCEWRDAVRILKRPSLENFDGISANVYSAIEVSYSNLESKKLKETFLLCCLMGHRASMKDLLKYGVGLGLLANTIDIEEARDAVRTLISKLRASSLLIDDCDNDYFDMHDLIHDVAVSIACGDHHGLLLTGDHKPKEWSDKEAIKDFKWICMRYANVDGLPEELESPHLTFFSLANKNPSQQIPANFFMGMQRLKVLDLTHMRMSSLPSSIQLLQNLHTLCLEQSELGDIRTIGELKNLEILSLLKSDFEELPGEIGQLTRLKLLDLSDCTKLKIIPPCVLVNMSRLEELYLGNSFDGWEVEENETQRNVSLAELKHLKKLTKLEVCIPDIRMIPKDLSFENLKKFKIFIGREWEGQYSSFGSSKILKLHLNASISFNLVKMLLKLTEELHLRELAGVKNVVDELNTEGFPDLKYLYVQNAPQVQHIIKSAEGVPFNAFPRLEVLFFQNLINLEKIFQGRFRDTVFNKIRTITIECCDKVKNLFSSSIARQLLHLQEISVIDCSNMEEIVDDEEQGSRNDIVEATELKFGNGLRSLRLHRLPKLRSLDKSCRHMPLFNEEVAFPSLEELELSWINVKTMWHASITSSHVAKLTKLIIEGCGNLEYLFPSSIALGLVQLYSLKVTNCAKMEQVITGEGVELLFPKLFTITLESCPNLKCFYEGRRRLEFPQLYTITVVNCPALAAFASSFSSDQKKEITTNDTKSEERPVIHTQPFFSDKVMLPNLKDLQLCWMNVNIKGHTSITYLHIMKLRKLIIQGLDNLEFLFSSCVARGLVMLERLEIRECKRMREIIITENAEEKENLIFLQLNYLFIKDLQNLVAFYLGNCTVEFPSLKYLGVLNCLKLEGFTVKYFESTSCIVDIQTLFNEQVGFPNLEWLTIIHLKNLEIIWHNKLYAYSFCKLKSLRVENCEKLLTVFPSPDIEGRIWKSLEELFIHRCGSLEGIFEIGEFNVKQTQAVIDTKFKELNIEGLPRLKHVWNKDPQGILTFHNLESVKVSRCGSLKNLFPASIGKSLLQLQKLHLLQCGVEEIVTIGEQGTEAIVNFEFPQVTSLKLEFLPRLQCFYRGKHTTTWPMLKEFCFSHFNQIKKANGHGQLDFPIRLPLFSKEKIIPQLEKLSLARNDIAMICEHEFKQDILFNGKVLQFQDYLVDELDVLPVGFLKRFYHLENLIVSYCNFKKLFPSKGEVEEQEEQVEIETLSRIKTLKLECLPYLKHIWSYDSSSFLQNLETLDIFRCDSLLILSNSTSSFQNLTTLRIISCKGMINLVSVSIAQSLVQLESMIVDNCHMLTEIVGNEGGGMQDYIMITFTKLKFLTLSRLPRLESFCSENFTFKFPCLEVVTVIQCPKLKIFSERDLNTPLLQRVLLEEVDRYRWEGDLNTTIQKMYMEEVGFVGLEVLRLSDFPKFMETWHIKDPQELLDFRQLRVLEICNCSKFRYLLTHSMVMGLVQLLQLIVKNCGTMEQVIMGEGAENKMEFPHLWLINLESCLDLTSFYVGSHSLELPMLYDFTVKDCPKMVTCAASTSSKEHDKEESQYLYCSKVETPNLGFLNLSSNNIQRILDNSILEILSYVQNLRKLCMDGCDNLKYLLTSSMVKTFEQLNWLEIRDCNMMEEVILAEEPMDEEKMCKIFFPNLEFLLLQDLPKLRRFCYGNYLELPCLWKLKISKCPVMKTFISSFTFGDMIASFENVKNTCTLSLFDAKVAFPKLERLVVEHVKSLNKIWNDQLEVDSFCQLTLVSVVSCEKLMNIFPFSMVERLQRLDKLQIWNCDSLEEILESQLGVSQSQAQKATPLPLLETVTCLEDDVKDGIVFSKLKYLQLCGLPRLSSFCSVKCKFEFPFLEEVILMDCPSVKTFSMDEIRTPKLQKVKLTGDEDEGFWGGNLNSRIQP